VRHRQHGDNRLDLRGRAHQLAFLLPLQHQPIPRGAAAVLWGRRTPTCHAQRRFIAVASCFRVEKPKVPFPQIDASTRVEKCLSRPKLKILECFRPCLRPTEKTAERLAVNVKAETKAIPAEKRAEDFIKP